MIRSGYPPAVTFISHLPVEMLFMRKRAYITIIEDTKPTAATHGLDFDLQTSRTLNGVSQTYFGKALQERQRLSKEDLENSYQHFVGGEKMVSYVVDKAYSKYILFLPCSLGYN